MTPKIPLPVVAPPENPDTMLPWEDKKGSANNRHNVRVRCDLAGLSLYGKDTITACVQQESDFWPGATNQNTNHAGTVLSTDWGIVQINDYYHIGQGKEFPSVQFVIANPTADVDWMIAMYKSGLLHEWVSYSSGAYLKFMPHNI